MKDKKFVSIIWGYPRHMYGFAPEENYHLHALKVAKDLGFKPYAIVMGNKENMTNDPNFDEDINVIDYKNLIQFFLQVLKFSFQNSVFYVNSYEWQSFVIPFLSRRTIFMAHTQPKRQTVMKQKIQNFVYKFFTAIRLNNEEEKKFLIKQGINPAKLFVVPLVVSQDVFKVIDPNEKRTELVYFGNVTELKNVTTIIEGFEIVKKIYPEIKLHIIGNIWHQKTTERINSSTYNKDIILHGFVPMNKHLNTKLNKRLIFLNSSKTEGQCVAVYDAALAGCVLCLPKIMSFAGVFKDKALFHDILDYNKLAENIVYYIKTPDLIIKHRNKCIKMIKEKYSKETVEKKITNLIKSI